MFRRLTEFGGTALALLALAPVTATSAPEVLSGRVVGITDGDTISVLYQGHEVPVRLEGIDCPELGQDFATRAKQATSGLVFGNQVRVQVRDVDRYGRIVGRVFSGDTDVSLALVEAGLCWHFKRYSSEAALAEAEERARDAGRGVWSRADRVPPWEYRRGAVAADGEVSEGPYHGNVRSRVFHGPWCQHYDCKNCTAVFETREDAVEAGFRPAGGCKP